MSSLKLYAKTEFKPLISLPPAWVNERPCINNKLYVK